LNREVKEFLIVDLTVQLGEASSVFFCPAEVRRFLLSPKPSCP